MRSKHQGYGLTELGMPQHRMETGFERGNKNVFIKEAARYLVYAVLACLVAEFLRWCAITDDSQDKFSEYSFVEYLQSFLLLLSGVVSFRFYLSKKQYPHRHIFMLIAALCAMAFIREQDIHFETLFGDGTWPIPVFLIIAVVAYKMFKARRVLSDEIVSYTKTKSYAFFSFATITIFVFSRLFGRTVFWQAVMEGQYFRSVKNVAEESLELYGYLFLFFAVIELVIASRQTGREMVKRSREMPVMHHHNIRRQQLGLER